MGLPQALLSELLEVLDVGVVVHGPDTAVVYANQAACRMLGISFDEVLARSGYDERYQVVDLAGRALEPRAFPAEVARVTGQEVRVQLGVRHPGGHRAWLTARAVPVGAAPRHVVVTLSDVTTDMDALRGESEARKKSEALYETVVRAMAEGLAIHGPGGRIRFANPAAERILGLSLDQLQGREAVDPRWALVEPDGRPLAAGDIPSEITGRTGQPVHGRLLGVHRPSGDRAWLSVSTEPIPGPGGVPQGVVASFTDITRERNARLEAERARAALAQLQAALPGVIFRWLERPGQTGELLEVSGRGLKDFEEPEPGVPVVHPGLIHPDDLGAVRAARRQALAGSELLDVHVRLRTRSGHRWFRAMVVPEKTEDGLLLTGVMLDVTEERYLAEGLHRAQRREAMGDLAAGVAHNFNNMLAAVLPNLESLRPLVPADAAPIVDESIEATRRAADLVRQLLYIGRPGQLATVRTVDLGRVAGDVFRLCRRTFDPGITLALEVGEGPLTVQGDEAQLQQVLLNLCINARDAVRGEPTRRIALAVRRSGALVQVEVRDTGHGMDDDTLRRLGEPFFTTKPPGYGTGLGLATVMRTVRELSGTIEVHSAPGEGTRVHLEVPVAESPAEAAASPAPVDRRGEGGRVLVVDDEPMVRRTVARTLRRHGFEVEEVGDGDGALAFVEGRPGWAEAVVLDLAMPGMSGEEALGRLTGLGYPVVIMSGAVPPEADLSAAAAVLQKPVDSTRLVAAVDDAVKR